MSQKAIKSIEPKDSGVKFDVTGYRVVIRQNSAVQTSAGGIIVEVGDAFRRKQAGQIFGTIVGMGGLAFTGKDFSDADRDIYIDCMNKGKTVMYRRYSGQCFSENPDDPNAVIYHVCADSDVMMPMAHDKFKSFV